MADSCGIFIIDAVVAGIAHAIDVAVSLTAVLDIGAVVHVVEHVIAVAVGVLVLLPLRNLNESAGSSSPVS